MDSINRLEGTPGDTLFYSLPKAARRASDPYVRSENGEGEDENIRKGI